MFCIKCGKEVAEGNRYCFNCGAEQPQWKLDHPEYNKKDEEAKAEQPKKETPKQEAPKAKVDDVPRDPYGNPMNPNQNQGYNPNQNQYQQPNNGYQQQYQGNPNQGYNPGYQQNPNYGYQQNQYQQKPNQYERKYNVFAIVGLVVSAISWVVDYYALVAIAGVVLSLIGYYQIAGQEKTNQVADKGQILAWIGIALGGVELFSTIAMVYGLSTNW